MFWPELDTAHARGALSQAVRFLRRELGSEQFIVSRGNEDLGVDSSAIWCDAVAFSASLRERQYGEALEFYRGDLLEGFFVSAGPAFDDWVMRERERLRDGAARAARALAEEREADEHYTTAVANARRAFELSHLDERAMRELLELLDRLGDRAGALHAYGEFVQRLVRELDTTPSPETVAVIERIRAGSPARDQRAKPGGAAAGAPGTTAEAPPEFERWRIEGELARSRMSTVYLARDARNDRPVAVKTMRPEMLGADGIDRFLREIRITASLAHPHILPLIDSGSANGALYLVTPYIPGESLRGRLRRESRLEIGEAVRLAREIANALDYAHRRGIVHRDIKPENVLLADGHALVADFGVADAGVVAAHARNADRSGVAVAGSPPYMSPEHAAGDISSGARSDLYSLGCVLHEMLTGALPGAGDSWREIRRRRPDVPRAVARLVSDCLDRDPARRPPGAADVARTLDASLAADRRTGGGFSIENWMPWQGGRLVPGRLAAVVVVVAGIVATAAYVAASAPAADPRPGVAVRPFFSVTQDPALAEALGVTISDSLAVALAALPTVQVVPIGQSDARRRYTVGGSYGPVGDSLEITIEIVDNARDRPLPSPRPVRVPAARPLESLDVVREAVLGALAYYTSAFGVDSAPPAERRPPTYAAYLAFAEGLAARQRSDWDPSETAFRRAIALDPTYTEAYYLLTGTFQNQAGRSQARGGIVGRFEAFDSLAHEMRRAIATPTAADRSMIDFLERYGAGDINGALEAMVRLAERVPAANYHVGFFGVLANRPGVATAGLERLDPDAGWTRESTAYWTQVAAALHQAGRYADELRAAQRGRARFPRALTLLNAEVRARIGLGDVDDLSPQDLQPIAVLRLALEMQVHGHPQQSRAWLATVVDSIPKGDIPFPDRIWIAMALLALDRLDEATAMLERSVQLDPLALDQRGMLGTAYARQGRRAEALRISQELAAVREPYLQGVPTLWRAKIAARLGDRETAVDLLARAFGEGVKYHPNFPSQRGTVWHSDPDFESLRGYRRYDDLTRPR